MDIKVVGIDLAKNVFQVCICLDDHSIYSNQKVTRSNLLNKVRQLPENTLIAMEACGTSHYWGRLFESMEYRVRLIPAQHVKPFVSNQKMMLTTQLPYVKLRLDLMPIRTGALFTRWHSLVGLFVTLKQSQF